MIQDQLIDYISAQVKAGTAKEVVRTTLLGVGWQAVDIDDSFKKVEGFSQPAQTTQPSVSPSAKPASQVIRMSDLVSSSDGPITKASEPMAAKPSFTSKLPDSLNKKVDPGAMSFPTTVVAGRRSTKDLVIGIAGGVVILILAGLSVYLYMQNNLLGSQVGSVKNSSQGVSAQIATLTDEVNTLTASTTALTASTAALTVQNGELATELAFYAVPLNSSPTSTPVSVTGVVGASAAKTYSITGTYGGRVFIANSKDAKVIAALQPFVGSSTQVMGTFVPGSQTMTVTSVNGVAL